MLAQSTPHTKGARALLDGKSFAGVISSPLPGRAPKPRGRGQTMIIDKGLGLGQTGDLLEMAADYIDYIKSCSNWGTRLELHQVQVVVGLTGPSRHSSVHHARIGAYVWGKAEGLGGGPLAHGQAAHPGEGNASLC